MAADMLSAMPEVASEETQTDKTTLICRKPAAEVCDTTNLFQDEWQIHDDDVDFPTAEAEEGGEEEDRDVD